jgi:hypothetical protein
MNPFILILFFPNITISIVNNDANSFYFIVIKGRISSITRTILLAVLLKVIVTDNITGPVFIVKSEMMSAVSTTITGEFLNHFVRKILWFFINDIILAVITDI